MYTIGIDLGGTNIVAAVVNEKYEIVSKAKTPTAMPRTPEEIFEHPKSERLQNFLAKVL